jgi:hypothetical protein
MQLCPVNTSSWKSCLTVFAPFAVVHGEQYEVSDFEIFVLDLRSYRFDSSCTLVPKDCRIRAELTYPLLIQQILVVAILALAIWELYVLEIVTAYCVTYSRVFHINKQLVVLHPSENYVFECEILLRPMYNISDCLNVFRGIFCHCDRLASVQKADVR